MDSRAIWLAVCLGFDSGLRIGNLALKDGKSREDHCIRAAHLASSLSIQLLKWTEPPPTPTPSGYIVVQDKRRTFGDKIP